jgi:predicted house-cleaning noncanonical NTP pyrophosphatase (MazG superfamily)
MSQLRTESSRNTTEEEGEQALTEDQVFEILSNRRRRFVFHYLKRERREVYLRELAEHVAAWEYEKPVAELSSVETKRVKTALHQHHLPKMDASGFVEYDSRRETVELAEGVADLEVYLDVVPGVDIPWSLYYLSLSTLGLFVLGGAWSDLGPFAWLPDISCAAFLTVVLLVSATIHTYFNYSRLRLGTTAEPPGVYDQ